MNNRGGKTAGRLTGGKAREPLAGGAVADFALQDRDLTLQRRTEPLQLVRRGMLLIGDLALVCDQHPDVGGAVDEQLEGVLGGRNGMRHGSAPRPERPPTIPAP